MTVLQKAGQAGRQASEPSDRGSRPGKAPHPNGRRLPDKGGEWIPAAPVPAKPPKEQSGKRSRSAVVL